MTAVSLRYPNAQLENDTDFLEIKVVKYELPVLILIVFNKEHHQSLWQTI